ncbi:hypothetical protein Bca4012_089166 [Brassica carinata]
MGTPPPHPPSGPDSQFLDDQFSNVVRYAPVADVKGGVASVDLPEELLSDSEPLWSAYIVGHFMGDAPHIGKVHAIVNRIWSFPDKPAKIDAQFISPKQCCSVLITHSLKLGSSKGTSGTLLIFLLLFVSGVLKQLQLTLILRLFHCGLTLRVFRIISSLVMVLHSLETPLEEQLSYTQTQNVVFDLMLLAY